jgi:tetratricopeptide (TPR) repeat protein
VRAALEHYLRQESDLAEAVKLAASFCPLLLRLSRLADCARWAQAALSRLPSELVGSEFEVRLQGALGQSLMFTGGDGDSAIQAFRRSIEVAECLQDFKSTLHLLNGYAVLLHRDGRYTDALSTARKAQSLLAEVDDPESQAIVDSLMGVALHLVGSVDEAMQHFEKCAAYGTSSRTDTASKLGFDHRLRALCGVARTLWLTGRYSQAVAVAEDTIAKARSHGHAVTYCIALLWAGSVFTYASDVERLDEMVDTLERVARQHSLTPYLNVASVTRGQMLITRGRPAEGVERIRTAVEALHTCRYDMVTSVSLTFMARGLSDLSLHSAALSVCNQVMRMIETGGDFLRMPDLLTTRGHVLAAAGERAEAAKSWRAAIDLARSQGVKSVQVKAAVALAQQMMSAGRTEEADRLVRPHVIAAGDETSPDLRVARSLLR